MLRTMFLAAAAAATLGFATPAAAVPQACGGQRAQPNSPMLGTWFMRVRDDGQQWRSGVDITFQADGTWWEQGQRAGIYCMVGDVLLFGYDENTLGDTEDSVLRFRYNPTFMQGTESWNSGGTGDAELTRR